MKKNQIKNQDLLRKKILISLLIGTLFFLFVCSIISIMIQLTSNLYVYPISLKNIFWDVEMRVFMISTGIAAFSLSCAYFFFSLNNNTKTNPKMLYLLPKYSILPSLITTTLIAIISTLDCYGDACGTVIYLIPLMILLSGISAFIIALVIYLIETFKLSKIKITLLIVAIIIMMIIASLSLFVAIKNDQYCGPKDYTFNDECFAKQAIAKGNSSLCNEISPFPAPTNCLIYYAKNTNNSLICEMIIMKDFDGVSAELLKRYHKFCYCEFADNSTKCLFNIAIHESNPEDELYLYGASQICSEMQVDYSECLVYFGVNRNTTKICNMISNETEVKRCIERVEISTLNIH